MEEVTHATKFDKLKQVLAQRNGFVELGYIFVYWRVTAN